MRRLETQRLMAVAAALLVLAVAFHFARQEPIYGLDFVPVHDGTRSLRVFQDPYQLVGQYGRNVYPPIVAVLLFPLAFVTQQAAVAFGTLIGAVSIVVLGGSLAAILGCSWRGRSAALLVSGLAVSHLGFSTLAIGNLSLMIGAGTALALALAASGRWLCAAVALGLMLAVKPIVLPVLLVFALERRWRAGLVAVALPAALNLAALPMLAEPVRFFTDTLSSLAAGETLLLQFNLSMGAVVKRAGGGEAVQAAARTAVALVTVVVAVLAWRRTVGTERLLIVGLVPVAGLVLASGTDQLHYALPLLPVLVHLAVHGAFQARLAAASGLLLLAVDVGFGGTTSQVLVIAAGGLAAATAKREGPPSIAPAGASRAG